MAGPRLGLRWEAEALADVLAGVARIHIWPLLCVHGGRGWRSGPLPAVQGVHPATLRQLPDVVRHGSRVQPSEVERATARLLEVLRPAV
jgi:hypothetical protein